MAKQSNINKDDSDMVQVADKEPVEVLGVCAYKDCHELASDGLLMPFCSNTCRLFAGFRHGSPWLLFYPLSL